MAESLPGNGGEVEESENQLRVSMPVWYSDMIEEFASGVEQDVRQFMVSSVNSLNLMQASNREGVICELVRDGGTEVADIDALEEMYDVVIGQNESKASNVLDFDDEEWLGFMLGIEGYFNDDEAGEDDMTIEEIKSEVTSYLAISTLRLIQRIRAEADGWRIRISENTMPNNPMILEPVLQEPKNA